MLVTGALTVRDGGGILVLMTTRGRPVSWPPAIIINIIYQYTNNLCLLFHYQYGFTSKWDNETVYYFMC